MRLVERRDRGLRAAAVLLEFPPHWLAAIQMSQHNGDTQGGVQVLEIEADEAGQRIDNYLVPRLKGVPKSRIYRLLRKGEIRVNKGRIKPDYRLKAGDQVRLAPIRRAEPPARPVPGAALRARLDRNVLLEEKDFLVIDKPSGLAVHGGSGVRLGLIEALRESRPDPFLELVHRLDRGTSGCLLVARSRGSLRSLQKQMRSGSVEKTYLALVAGRWPAGLDRVDAPLKRQLLASGDRIVRPSVEGKRAATGFRIVRRYEDATLVEATLETGRTHQIRVHCQLAGHPLAGDDKYGSDAFNEHMRRQGLRRLFLHAHRLRFRKPGIEDLVDVQSPLPDDLVKVLDKKAVSV